MEGERRDEEPAQAVPDSAQAAEPAVERVEVVPDRPDELNKNEPIKTVVAPETVAEPQKAAPVENQESAIREWFELIGRAAFWALILYLFVFQVSVVEGPSMQPNFHTSDRLVIDKLTYRFTPVKRFDVIVFQAVEHDWYGTMHESKDYIKRVIGLPGERISLKGNTIAVNGKPLTEPFEFDRQICYYGMPEDFVVPPRHYFVLGDNRGDSKDSRSSALGYVPESQIRGIARLRFMPLDRWTWFGRY